MFLLQLKLSIITLRGIKLDCLAFKLPKIFPIDTFLTIKKMINEGGIVKSLLRL